MLSPADAGASIPSVEHRSVWRAVFHNWGLLVVFAVIGGALGWVVGSRTDPVYEAQTVVTVSKTQLPTEDFDLGTTIFETDTVIVPVIEELGLDVEPQKLLGSGQLQAQPVTGGGLSITGQAAEPDLAVDLANAAAESFATQLRLRDLGTAAVLSATDADRAAGPTESLLTVTGLVVGGLLGLVISVIVFFIRQPVLSEREALGEFPADAAFSVRVRPAARWTLRRMKGTAVFPGGVIGAIWRSARSPGKESPRICCVLVGRRRRDKTLRALISEMRVASEFSGQTSDNELASLYWVRARDGSLPEAFDPADVVVALVSEGAPRKVLRGLAEELLVAPEQKRWTLVFVRSARSLSAPPRESSPDGDSRLAEISHSPTPESERTQARST